MSMCVQFVLMNNKRYSYRDSCRSFVHLTDPIHSIPFHVRFFLVLSYSTWFACRLCCCATDIPSSPLFKRSFLILLHLFRFLSFFHSFIHSSLCRSLLFSPKNVDVCLPFQFVERILLEFVKIYCFKSHSFPLIHNFRSTFHVSSR